MIPLKVGFKWTWNVTSYDINGNIKQSHLYYTQVIKDTIINGEKWFLLSEMDYPESYLNTNRNGVTYSYYAGKPTIVFNTNIEDTSIPSTNSNLSYLVSKNNLIQGPLGDFNCNLYQIFIHNEDKKLLNTNYYIEYNKAKVKETIQKELAWRDYGGKHYESRWTRYFQGWWLPAKWLRWGPSPRWS